MNYQYTQIEYKAAIMREMAKRVTTYPKIIDKMIKQGATEPEVNERKTLMNRYNKAIEWACTVLDSDVVIGDLEFIVIELIREYKMRKRCYARFVMFKRMTSEVAEYETFVWRELCIYFIENFTECTDPEVVFYDLTDSRQRGKRKKRAET